MFFDQLKDEKIKIFLTEKTNIKDFEVIRESLTEVGEFGIPIFYLTKETPNKKLQTEKGELLIEADNLAKHREVKIFLNRILKIF